MSLDGFVAGPNVSTEQPMGEGAGASVHDWMFSGKRDAEAERFERDHGDRRRDRGRDLRVDRGGPDWEADVRRPGSSRGAILPRSAGRCLS